MITSLSAKDLRRAANLKERIEKLAKQLEAIIGGVQAPEEAAQKKAAAPTVIKRRRRRMSKKAKAAQAERLRKRWAKVKAAGRHAL